MTVLLRRKVIIGGEEREIKVFLPSGGLSRQNQDRAEQLDSFLAEKAPLLADKIMRLPKDTPPLRKWYLFGKELRKIVDDNDLVLRTDVANGLIWEAIKYHLPQSIGLKGAGQVYDEKLRHGVNRGHLVECYAIASYPWKDVAWFHRWTDWTWLYSRESMWRDKRVLTLLRAEITGMKKYPNRAGFTKILKNLSAETTKKDISVLDDSMIAEKVHNAVMQAAL